MFAVIWMAGVTLDMGWGRGEGWLIIPTVTFIILRVTFSFIIRFTIVLGLIVVVARVRVCLRGLTLELIECIQQFRAL